MRRIIGLVLVASALFSVIIGLIRAQPYDDHHLRADLEAGECAAPCFMGIRPGVTRVEEAFNILRQNPWVDWESIDRAGLAWRWSGQQPDWIDGTQVAALDKSSDDVVVSIRIKATIRFGDIWLMYGQPNDESGVLGQGPTVHPTYAILDRYFQFVAGPVYNRCHVWQTPIAITVLAEQWITDDRGWVMRQGFCQ